MALSATRLHDIKSEESVLSAKGSLMSASSALISEQKLYRGGDTTANVDRAERLARLERAHLTATEQDALLNAVEVKTDLSTNLAVLELAKQSERRLDRQLAATRERLRIGEVSLRVTGTFD